MNKYTDYTETMMVQTVWVPLFLCRGSKYASLTYHVKEWILYQYQNDKGSRKGHNYSRIPILRPPLGLSKSGLKDSLLSRAYFDVFWCKNNKIPGI